MDIPFVLSVADPATAGLKEGKKTPRAGFLYPTPDSDLYVRVEGDKASPACQRKSTASNRCLQFEERRHLFIRTPDKMLSVAMRVHNPDRAALKIQS